MLSYNISSSADQARGKVYDVNPMQTPTLIDATFDGLDAPGNLLRGASLDVTQATGTRMDCPNGDFTADPKNEEFDEPQVYHHLWRAAEYFRGITSAGLMDAAPFTPMRVLVNDPGSPNNAYYSPSSGELRFGLFGSRSSARSAAVVIHEFGHAISDGICQLGRSPVRDTEARGLSEGFSDYFAASLLDDPRLGDYVADDEHGARNCSDQLQFPPDFVGEEHSTGAVWASILWAIRSDAGQDVCDGLAVGSLDFLDNTSTFEDARTALHSVDAKLNGDANKDLVDREFDSRGP
jgi:Fungalysin metallopeptidase (M36)